MNRGTSTPSIETVRSDMVPPICGTARVRRALHLPLGPARVQYHDVVLVATHAPPAQAPGRTLPGVVATAPRPQRRPLPAAARDRPGPSARHHPRADRGEAVAR